MINISTMYRIIYTISVLTGVHSFSYCSNLSQQKVKHRLFATKKDDSSGAGAWRAKAKEFQDNPEGFADSDKKLNIAFVVSSICMYTICKLICTYDMHNDMLKLKHILMHTFD